MLNYSFDFTVFTYPYRDGFIDFKRLNENNVRTSTFGTNFVSFFIYTNGSLVRLFELFRVTVDTDASLQLSNISSQLANLFFELFNLGPEILFSCSASRTPLSATFHVNLSGYSSNPNFLPLKVNLPFTIM